MPTSAPPGDLVTHGWSAVMMACAMSGFALSAHAFEPPRLSIENAMNIGRVAFIGRVQSLKDVRQRPSHRLARAHLVVLKCLYGKSCRDRSKILMNFTADTFAEGALGVDFSVGREYLVVLKHAKPGTLTFGSQWPDNMDIAYTLKTPLGAFGTVDQPGADLAVENIWGGRVEAVGLRQLEEWAARRVKELPR